MTHLHRRLALLLVVALPLVAALSALAAPSHDQTVQGRVFASDLATPVPGLAVEAFAEGESTPAARATTDPRGRFSLDGLAEGAYLLLLKSPSGDPLAAAEVTVARSSRAQVVSLALPDEEGTAGESGSAAQGTPAGGGGFKAWLKTPLGATIAIIVSAIVLSYVADEVTDDNPRLPESQILP